MRSDSWLIFDHTMVFVYFSHLERTMSEGLNMPPNKQIVDS